MVKKKWERQGDVVKRTAVKLRRLNDVSPATFPANPDTTVAARCYDQYRRELEDAARDQRRRDADRLRLAALA